MEGAILTAVTGLAGSLVGAASSMATTWLTQRGQQKAQWRTQEATRREALYDEFISEASKCLIDAISRDPDGPEVLLSLFAIVGRMRLRSSRPVIEAAERLIALIVNSYASPNVTFEQVRTRIMRGEEGDPLADFGAACRSELELLRS